MNVHFTDLSRRIGALEADDFSKTERQHVEGDEPPKVSSEYLWTRGVGPCILVAAFNEETHKAVMGHFASLTQDSDSRESTPHHYPGRAGFDRTLEIITHIGPGAATEVTLAGTCNEYIGDKLEWPLESRAIATCRLAEIGCARVTTHWTEVPDTIIRTALLDCEAGVLTIEYAATLLR